MSVFPNTTAISKGSCQAAKVSANASRSRVRGLHPFERRILLFAGDFIAVGAGAAFAVWLWSAKAAIASSPISSGVQAMWFGVLVPAWMLLALDLFSTRVAASARATLKVLTRVATVSFTGYLCLFFFAPRDLLPRFVVLTFILIAFLLCLSWRVLYIRVFVSPQFQRRLLFLGAGWELQVLRSAVAELHDQYAIVGVVQDRDGREGPSADSIPILGPQRDLLAIADNYSVSEIVLPVGSEVPGSAFQLLTEAIAKGISVVRFPALYEEVTGRVPIEHLDSDWMVGAFLGSLRRPAIWTRIWKRSADLIGAVIGLLFLSLAFPFIALAIWTESRGPILYKQARLGRDGVRFNIVKFRTMIPNAEAVGGAQWAHENDSRTTRVGRLLRRTRIDEFPQFLNVLRGEMSLVGPRPERPEFFDALEASIPFYRTRLVAKPGITGWAQVMYRYGASKKDSALKLEYDLYYIKHQSLCLDLLILWRTVGVVIGLKGR